MTALTLATASNAADFAAGRGLFEEYAAALDVDLCFQNFARELESLDHMYAPPGGCLLLARAGEHCIGCVGVRRFDAITAELKRLYVQPAFRGSGAGDALLTEAIARARRLGYRRLVLDTLPDMHAARALYLRRGFHEIAAYADNPLLGLRYFALDLPADAHDAGRHIGGVMADTAVPETKRK